MWRPQPGFVVIGWSPPTTKSFMLTTVEFSCNKSVRILLGFRRPGSGTEHGAYESNAWLAGLESALGPAELARPICSFRPCTLLQRRPRPGYSRCEALVSEIF